MSDEPDDPGRGLSIEDELTLRDREQAGKWMEELADRLSKAEDHRTRRDVLLEYLKDLRSRHAKFSAKPINSLGEHLKRYVISDYLESYYYYLFYDGIPDRHLKPILQILLALDDAQKGVSHPLVRPWHFSRTGRKRMDHQTETQLLWASALITLLRKKKGMRLEQAARHIEKIWTRLSLALPAKRKPDDSDYTELDDWKRLLNWRNRLSKRNTYLGKQLGWQLDRYIADPQDLAFEILGYLGSDDVMLVETLLSVCGPDHRLDKASDLTD